MQPSITIGLGGARRREAGVVKLPHQRLVIRLASCLALAAFAYLCWLMALITAQYVPADVDVAFLRVKTAALTAPYYRYAFFAHVYTSLVVLLVGAPQFSTVLRERYPTLHRGLGRVYVGLVLAAAAPTGLVMAYHANGGWTAQLSFALQAVLWWAFTYRALATIRRGDVAAHRRYVLYSYAMTLSALTLRLWKWGIVTAWAPPPMDTYRAVAWLGWTVNLLAAYLYLEQRERYGVRTLINYPRP